MLIFVGCVGLTELATSEIFHDPDYYRTHRWPAPAGIFLSSLVVKLCLKPRSKPNIAAQSDWLVSSSLEHHDPTRDRSLFSLIQVFQDRDRFFLIPVRFWPWILFGISILLFFIPLDAI